MVKRSLLIFCFIFSLSPILGQDLIPNKVLSDKNGLTNNICRTIVQDENGKLWFGTTSGILIYDGTNVNAFEPSDGETVIKLIQTEGHIIALTIKSLYRINMLDHKFTMIDLPITDYYRSAYTDSYIQLITNEKDTLWYDFNLEKIEGEPLAFSYPKITLGDYEIFSDRNYYITLHSDTIDKGEANSPDIKKINDSLAFIGTHNGLVKVELKKGGIVKNRFMPGLRIDCVFLDRDKNLWIGTADNGIYFIHKNNYLNYFREVRHEGEKVSCWSIFSIDSTVYLTTQKGIQRLDGEEDEFTKNTKNVRSIAAFYYNQALYIGTATNGILKYSNGNTRQIYFNEDEVLDNTIMQIFNQGDTLIGLSKENLIFLKNDQVVKTIPYQELGIDPYVMHIDKSENNYWLSATTGVLKCNLNFDVLDRYSSKTSRIICMANLEGEEPIFASMDDGLQRIKNHSLVPYHPSENNYFFCTLYDSSNKSYWTSSGNGLFYSNDRQSFMFSSENGLPISSFNQSGYFRYNNEIIFSGGGGAFKFNPNYLLDTPTLPTVEIKVNNAFPASNEIELDYDQGTVIMELNPILPTDKNLFEIEYFVKDTKDNLTTQKQLNLKVDYGTTRFRCVVRNKLTEETSETEYLLIRKKPFWLNLWFKILMGILALLALTGFYFFAKYLVTRRKLRLQEQQNSINQERLRISRELHDNIGARLSYIISSIDLEKHNKNADYKNLEPINSFARDTMTELRETIWAVGNKNVNLSELAHRIDSYCKEVSEFSDINIAVKPNIKRDKELKPIETINFYRITQEAVNNANKYSEAGEVVITITDWTISIVDNGKGFNLEESTYGNGLINMKIRADECGAELKISSHQNKGTHVTILF